MRCKRHLLCLLAQLWLKLCCELGPVSVLGWKCCTKSMDALVRADALEDDPEGGSDDGCKPHP